jgi:hexosaminidase
MILAAMADAKLNVLNWHMAGDDCFGIELTTYPGIS